MKYFIVWVQSIPLTHHKVLIQRIRQKMLLKGQKCKKVPMWKVLLSHFDILGMLPSAIQALTHFFLDIVNMTIPCPWSSPSKHRQKVRISSPQIFPSCKKNFTHVIHHTEWAVKPLLLSALYKASFETVPSPSHLKFVEFGGSEFYPERHTVRHCRRKTL